MSFMTIAALTGSLLALAIGVASIIGEGGYSFDLRRRNGRRKDSNRLGGRRENDGATSVA
jgi:hypothetical protein